MLAGLLKGDEIAFKHLVNTYKNRVYNTVLGFVPNRHDAEDITQEVFVKVYQHIHTFKRQSKLSTWLYRVSVSQALDFVRHKNRKKRFAFLTGLLGNDNEPLHEPADFAHPGVLMENRERSAILFGAMDKLPEKQRTAFVLQKVQDMSQQQIAEVMELNEGAVESLLTRARANLKKLLINYYSSI